jgi:HlyD family secretion protein
MTPTPKALAALLVLSSLSVSCREPESDRTARVSGHVEATEVQIAPEVAGRIVELNVAEGDRVGKGDVIARLDTRNTELEIARARAERAAADAQLRLVQAGSRREDIRQAEAQVEAAQADVTAIAADLRAADEDLRRFESLLAANAGSQKQRDDARARVDVGKERQRGAEDRVHAAQEQLARLRSGARPQEVELARARVASVDAQIAALMKHVADAEVAAPVAGIVTQKLMDAGELAAPGVPVAVVTDLDHAWANVFVPEPLIPRVKLGQTATVHTDAGGQGLDGKVTFVSPKAEFTPRNVQTADERSKLVYRIKVTVDNRDGILKPGMPVDAVLHLP